MFVLFSCKQNIEFSKKTGNSNFKFSKSTLSREEKVKEIDNVDFINYNYKNLDEDYKIIINSEDFDRTLAEYKFIKPRIRTYNDSLSVALMHEFKDWVVADVVKRRLLFSWERLGYYLHRDGAELKSVAKKLNLNHPYSVFYHLKLDKYNSRIKEKEIKRLKKIISTKTNKTQDDIDKLTNDELLNLSFENHDEIIQMKSEYMKTHKH